MIRLTRALTRRTPADLDLYAAVVKRSEALFKERYGGRFHVLLWDRGDPGYAEVLSAMQKQGLSVTQIKDILSDYPANREKYRIPYDSHPNQLAHEMIARHLVKTLL
jgi:hypothetical protein